MVTNADLARLNQVLRSSHVRDLQVSYKTHLALKTLSNLVETTLKPVGDLEKKYIEDREADEEYTQYITLLNELNNEYLGNPVIQEKLIEFHKVHDCLKENQVKRTAEFQAVLDSPADIEIKPLDPETYSDFYDAEFPNEIWDALSPVLKVD